MESLAHQGCIYLKKLKQQYIAIGKNSDIVNIMAISNIGFLF